MYLLCHVNYYTLKYSHIPTMLVQKIRHNVTNGYILYENCIYNFLIIQIITLHIFSFYAKIRIIGNFKEEKSWHSTVLLHLRKVENLL